MSLVIDEVWLPATLTAPPMTDEEFTAFCEAHPDYVIEMTAEGELVIMPPDFSLAGFRNAEIAGQLREWARRDRRGAVTDPSSGFVLPNGARRSPDVAWVLKTRIPAVRAGYWHLSPDFVIELRSDTDRIRTLRAKMQEWVENGTQLAWLIDPERKAVEVYRAGHAPEIHESIVSLAAGEPLIGFEIDLIPVWEPLDF